MNGKRITKTALRVFSQLRNDHRSVALILLMPSVLLTVLKYVFDGNSAMFGSLAPVLLGIFPFTLMFIIASVAVLRERILGTLERVLTSPASRADVILGYALAFGIVAMVQAGLAMTVMLTFLNVSIAGPLASLLLVAVLSGVMGMAFGLLFSAFARNEFQAVQFMPAFVLPQLLTCGLFTPRESMAWPLRYFSDVMPITYVVKALQEVRGSDVWTTTLTTAVLVIVGFIVVALGFGAYSLRIRR